MKIVQIIGLVITLLALSYYSSFADRITSGAENGSASLGIGLIIVFLMAFTSAILLIPSSFILWKTKAREYFGYKGAFWNSLLVANSALAIAYSVFGLWLAFSLVIAFMSN